MLPHKLDFIMFMGFCTSITYANEMFLVIKGVCMSVMCVWEGGWQGEEGEVALEILCTIG